MLGAVLSLEEAARTYVMNWDLRLNLECTTSQSFQQGRQRVLMSKLREKQNHHLPQLDSPSPSRVILRLHLEYSQRTGGVCECVCVHEGIQLPPDPPRGMPL